MIDRYSYLDMDTFKMLSNFKHIANLKKSFESSSLCLLCGGLRQIGTIRIEEKE